MAAGGSGTNMDDSQSSTEDEYWRGCAMEEIYRGLNPFELEHVPPVRPSDAHTVLHSYPISEPDTVAPRPYKAHHKWDAQHVRLPCSSKSQYPVTAEDGKSTIESRWQMIEKALRQPITNSREFQAAVLSYNSKYEKFWDFFGLHVLFEKELDESEGAVFFEDLLPRIIRLALRLPELVQAPIPLLRQGQNHSVTLTQEQIACLLANAFLCTFPRRNTLKKGSEYSNFSDINFNRLYQTHNRHTLEKIKCICHYFRRVCPTARGSANVPTGVVTFTRRSLSNAELPNWADCDAPLGITPLHITAAGTIEDQGIGLLQVDFANKFLGGGVLREGCVQEEIRFVICPELLVSKLFIEYMRPTEAVVIVGCERYSNYTGYANSFQWAGNHEDSTPRDCSRRRMTHVVAIDAMHFMKTPLQYREEFMLRELNKAYAGFVHPLVTPAPGVASGNWGCGAFGGNALLKALLQLMVCTVTKRPLVYYTFGNGELRDEVHRMHTFFIEHNVCVKDLWMALKRFESQNLAPKELYNFLYSCLCGEPKYSPSNQKTPTLTKSVKSKHCADATGPTTTDTRTSTASVKHQSQSPNSQSQRINDSLDLFASSSESEHDAEGANLSVNKVSPRSKEQPPSKAATSTSNISTVDLCTPDSDSCPAPGEVNAHDRVAKAKEQQQSAAATATSSTSKSPARNAPRQRTLLEMLDRSYAISNGSSRPAPKRLCLSKNTNP